MTNTFVNRKKYSLFLRYRIIFADNLDTKSNQTIIIECSVQLYHGKPHYFTTDISITKVILEDLASKPLKCFLLFGKQGFLYFTLESSIQLRGGSRTAATSKMERFVTKRYILHVAAALGPPLELIYETGLP